MTLRTYLSRLIWFSVLPLVLLAVYLAVNHVNTVHARLKQEATRQVRNAATAIDIHLKAQIAALEMLGASPLIDDPRRWGDLHKAALGLRESFGGHVILADPSLQMLLNTRVPFGEALPKLPRPRGRAAAPAALETRRPAVGDRFFGPVAREPMVAVVVPVMRDAEPRYLLLSTIETGRFQKQLEQIALPAQRVLTLLDGTGEVIARRAPRDFDSDAVGAPQYRRFVARSAVAPSSVTLEIPVTVFRAPVIAAAAALAAAILIATLIGVAGGRIAARGLARSVAALTDPGSVPPLRPAVAEIAAVRTRLADAQAMLEGQTQILEMIATGLPLGQTLEALIRVIEKGVPGMLGSILLLDADGVHVRHGAAPSLPEDYVRALDGEPIGEQAGSCGTAMYRREPVIVEDLAIDPLWEKYRAIALEHGLRACWSTPLFDQRGRVLGSFAMYCRSPRRPAPAELRWVETATRIAALAIVRARETAALRESEERFRELAENIQRSILADRPGDGHDALREPRLRVGLGPFVREPLRIAPILARGRTPGGPAARARCGTA